MFLSWTNEQETSKRGEGDVFIHPTVKSNRYLPTQQNTRWPDTPVDRNGRNSEQYCWVTGRTDQGWPNTSDRARCLLYFDLTLDRIRSVMTGRVRSSEYLTGTWPDTPITSQSHPIRCFSFYDTCQRNHRVRSSQGPRPINRAVAQ
jgi:hypothetical protein